MWLVFIHQSGILLLSCIFTIQEILHTLNVFFESLYLDYKSMIFTYRISWLTATSIGDLPSLFLAKSVGCLVNKNLRQS